ncbi:hypothetical protein L1049_003664 [Liquidambar formosana]|uniref:Alpha/beta hydrolase fold-3 domain-containing protein n=1 Tax=Liquidambar formosana TaxID=63359 RepID=A0AAP0RRD6_LIQFO
MSTVTPKSPALPWKARLFLTTFTFAVDASRRSNGTINRFLSNFLDLKVSPSKKPINGVTSLDVTVDPSRNLWFRLYIPAAEVSGSHVSLPVIIFFHGGGFAFLAADSKPSDDFCRRLAGELRAVVVSVNYRLSPEHRYPCQYEDGFDVLKFVDERGFDEFLPVNADLSRCFLAGDSAGSNLAHHVAVKVGGYDQLREVKVIGLMAIQPFFGGEERTESEMKLVGMPIISVERTDWLWKAFLPEGADRDHPVVNVFGPKSADISGVKFPATVVFVGGFDPLQDWQKRYYEGLKKSGKEVHLIEYPNATHGFYAFQEFPESSLLITELRAFLEKQSAKKSMI